MTVFIIICLIISVLSLCTSFIIICLHVRSFFKNNRDSRKSNPFAGISFAVRLTKADFENMRLGSNNGEIRKENKTGDNRKSIN